MIPAAPRTSAMTSRCLLPIALSALLAPAASGHDMWIEPSSFTPKAGQLVQVCLRVGHPAKGVEPVARNSARIVRFSAVTAAGEEPVQGVDGADPAGLLRPAAEGLTTLAYRTNHASSELPGDRFEAYLAEEGLSAVQELRRRRGQSTAPGRERYSRSLKALVDVGGGREGADEPLGLDLELVAESNPYRLQPGQVLAVRVLYRGAPLAGARVDAFALDGASPDVTATSDADGRVRLLLPKGGGWAVTTTHMFEAPAGTGADWESLWASLTFAVPGP